MGALLGSCNEPSFLGAELLEDDQAEVVYTDTFSFTMQYLPDDSVLTYNPARGVGQTYLFGLFDDPILGQTEAGIFLRLNGPSSNPGFEGGVLDSLVLLLPYDSTGFYGETDVDFGLEVYRLSEDLDDDASYYSNSEVVFEPDPIGRLSFRPNFRDSVFVTEASGGSEVNQGFRPHLRVRLDQVFAEELFGLDTLVYETDSAFLEALKGFYLKPTLPGPGMASFNLSDDLAEVRFYYHQDTAFRRYSLGFDPVIFNTLSNDYSGSAAEAGLDDPAFGDSLVFLQGSQGLTIKVEFPKLPDFQDVVVNKAELEWTIASLPGDDTDLYPPVDQIVAFKPQGDTTRVFIEDVVFVLDALSDLAAYFGGVVTEEGDGSTTLYRFNLSAYMQEFFEGNEDGVLYFRALNRAETAARSVLYGPGHSVFPARLKLSYTQASK